MATHITEPSIRVFRILHLEDAENDHALVRELLRREKITCELRVIHNRDDFKTALCQDRFDLILSDYTLPSFDGMSALTIARELCPETPFVFFSGTIGEEAAVEALKRGAVDYVLKQRPGRLVAAIRRALHDADERRRRQHAEHALQQSEERFRIVARATNDVVWEWDIKTDKIWFSENFQTVFGHSGESIGTAFERWVDLIHPDEQSRVVTGMTTSLASGGRIWWSEHRFRRTNGTYAYVFDRATVVYDPAGKPLRVVGVTIDVTERKQSEEKIRELAVLLDKAGDAIAVCDTHGQIVYWNQGAARVLGWTADEALGRNYEQLVCVNHSSALDRVRSALLRGGEWNGELTQRHRDGRQVVVYSRWTLVRDESGQPRSRLIINTDVTEQKRLEEQFLRTQRLQGLGVLVSGIAHDMKNMLVPICTGVQILRERPEGVEPGSILKTMEAATQRCVEMIKQMLAFARGGEIDRTFINPNQLVNEMARMIRDTFPREVQCEVQVDRDTASVWGYSTQLHQVLLNLCVNARDAMPRGGTLKLSVANEPITAEAAAARPGVEPGNYVRISVADTGVGIPAEQLNKIFEPFFTTKPSDKGTGLGLSTSLNIVKNHGGFMTVDSQVGVGTEFVFHLPAAARAATPVIAGENRALPAGAGECLLIVDDEAATLAIMRMALENYNYQVLTASNGMEAITYFTQQPESVSLVITDLMMPHMGGSEVIASLRKIRPEVKIIMASGSEKEMDGILEACRPDAFIAKPFTNETLLRTVQNVLAGR